MYDVGDLGDALPGAPVAGAVAALVESGNRPDVLLVPASYDGRDVAGRLSVRLDAPVITNVVGLAADGDDVRSQHGLFGGAQVATARFTGAQPWIFVVRAKSFAAEAAGGGAAQVVSAPVPELGATNGAKVIARHAEERTGPKLDEAEVVVSGGRGLGGAEHYAMIEELAKLLHGAAGASRAIVDAGWVPYSHQVGQTGKTVKPTLYIACGISGATQHLVGMKGVEEHHRHQQGPGRPDLLGGRPRHRGRCAQGAAQADRGAQSPQLNGARSGAAPSRLSRVDGTTPLAARDRSSLREVRDALTTPRPRCVSFEPLVLSTHAVPDHRLCHLLRRGFHGELAPEPVPAAVEAVDDRRQLRVLQLVGLAFRLPAGVGHGGRRTSVPPW